MEDTEKTRLRIIQEIVDRGQRAIGYDKEIALYAYVEGVMALIFSCGVKLNDMGIDIKKFAPELMTRFINANGPFMDLAEYWDSEQYSGNDVLAMYMEELKELSGQKKKEVDA